MLSPDTLVAPFSFIGAPVDYAREYDQTVDDIPMPSADTKRRKLTLTERLAATLCQLKRIDPTTGRPIPVIDPEWAKAHSAKEIVDAFEKWHDWDHKIALELNGTNHPSNIAPLTRLHHETVKTPADLTAIAKAKRLARKNAGVTAKQLQFRADLLRPEAKVEQPRVKKKARPMPGTKRSGWKHCMDGNWEKRK